MLLGEIRLTKRILVVYQHVTFTCYMINTLYANTREGGRLRYAHKQIHKHMLSKHTPK